MIIILKYNEDKMANKALFEAELVLKQLKNGSYEIAKNRDGESGVVITEDLLPKVIANPSGSLVYDWR